MNYISKIVFVPAVCILHAFMWYDTHVNGIEPKSGQSYYKHKIINGKEYCKRKGLKNCLKSWKPINSPKLSDNDLALLYPSKFIE